LLFKYRIIGQEAQPILQIEMEYKPISRPYHQALITDSVNKLEISYNHVGIQDVHSEENNFTLSCHVLF
jgi:hypothetical protein